VAPSLEKLLRTSLTLQQGGGKVDLEAVRRAFAQAIQVDATRVTIEPGGEATRLAAPTLTAHIEVRVPQESETVEKEWAKLAQSTSGSVWLQGVAVLAMSYPTRCSPGSPLHGADKAIAGLVGLFPATTGLRLSYTGLVLPIPITDHALPPLAALTNLITIQLEASGVTDSALRYLKRCRALRHLDIAGCRGLSDAGLEAPNPHSPPFSLHSSPFSSIPGFFLPGRGL